MQMQKKLKNRGKKPLPHSENQTLRIFSNHVKKPLTITDEPIRKKLKNLGKKLLQHIQN